MKTGAEIVDFKSFNGQNKQSIGHYGTLQARMAKDIVDTNREVFDVDELEEEDYGIDDESDDLDINGGNRLKKFNSHPYGTGTAPNPNDDNGVSRVKKIKDFKY